MGFSQVRLLFKVSLPLLALAGCSQAPTADTSQQPSKPLINHANDSEIHSGFSPSQRTATISPDENQPPQGQLTVQLPVDPAPPLDTPVRTVAADGSIAIVFGNSQQTVLSASVDCDKKVKIAHDRATAPTSCSENVGDKP